MFTKASIDRRMNPSQSILLTTFGFILTLSWLVNNLLDKICWSASLFGSRCVSVFLHTWLGECMYNICLPKPSNLQSFCDQVCLPELILSSHSSSPERFLFNILTFCFQMEWEQSSVPRFSSCKNLSLWFRYNRFSYYSFYFHHTHSHINDRFCWEQQKKKWLFFFKLLWRVFI